MTNAEKLMLLRVQLYGAAQGLRGQEAVEFFDLLREVLKVTFQFETDARNEVEAAS